MSYKDVVFYLDSLADEGMARNFDVLTKFCALLDLDKRPNLAVISYGAPVQIDECKNAHTRSQPYIWGDATEFWSNYARRGNLLDIRISNHPNRIY